jgi:hypothetical protein
MFEGNGYFPTWCADWMHRMVSRAESDARYARHEAVLTVWPFDYNGSGQTSITGLIRMDDDGDGTEDRIATIRKGIFNYLELLAHLNRDLDALPERTVEGIRFGGVRSPSADVHRFLVYNHDKYDTGSDEETEFTAHLSLTGLPWENVNLRRWRVDRDHSSPYHAYQALPEQDLYAPADIVDLEATDDLVEDGPQQNQASPGGATEIAVPLRVNGVTLVEIQERDLDGDGHPDSGDNCPATPNPGQGNGDEDSRGTACDCDDGNGQVWATPGEVRDLWLSPGEPAGNTALHWQAPADPGGETVRYDTLRSGEPSSFTIGATCVEWDDAADTETTDADLPSPGAAFYYLVRAENDCPSGQGSLGTDSAGTGRTGRTCP